MKATAIIGISIGVLWFAGLMIGLGACTSDSNMTFGPQDQGTVTVMTESKRGNVRIFVNDVSVGTAPTTLVFACGDTVRVRVE